MTKLYTVAPTVGASPPIGLLQKSPSGLSSGTVYSGDYVEYRYPRTNAEIIDVGPLLLQLVTNISVQDTLYVQPQVIRVQGVANDVRTTLWSGAAKQAGVGAVLFWQDSLNYNFPLQDSEIRLRLNVSGSFEKSVVFGTSSDNYIDLSILQGSHQQDQLFSRGDFVFYLRRHREMLWSRGNVVKKYHDQLVSRATYHAHHTEYMWSRGKVSARHRDLLYSDGDIQIAPPLSVPGLLDVKVGGRILRSDGKLARPHRLDEVTESILSYPITLERPILEAPPEVGINRAAAARHFLETIEALRADAVEYVPGYPVEAIDPAELDITDEYDYDALTREWRLKTGYSRDIAYPMIFPCLSTLARASETMFMIRYRPMGEEHRVSLQGEPGRLLIYTRISSFEEAKVWYWRDPVGRPSIFQFRLDVTNNTGSEPGFAGTGAGILTA